MRKLALMMVCISLLLTGCWDYQEVDRLATVLAIGIDSLPGNNSILLTVQIANPVLKGGGGQSAGGGAMGAKAFTVMNSEGETVSEAVRNLSPQSTRRILFSHCKEIVIGKNLAETGMVGILDYLKRDRELRRTEWILTTDKTAKEILESDITMEQVPARGLEHILLNYQTEGRVLAIDLNDFFNRLNGDSHVSFAPLVQLEDIDQQVNTQLEKATGKALDSEKKPETITIGTMAVFKNLKMVGVLDEDDSRDLKWLVDSPKGSSIKVAYSPVSQTNGNKGEIALDIVSGKSTITPQISENGITMNIALTANVALHETGTSDAKVLDPKVVEQIEQQAAETMKLQMEHTIDIAQNELRSDCVGFAESIHNHYPNEWKSMKDNWEDIFPTLDYQVSCKVRILRTGMINDPSLPGDAGGVN